MSGSSANNNDFNESNEQTFERKKEALKSLVTSYVLNLLPIHGLIAPAAIPVAWSYNESDLIEHQNELGLSKPKPRYPPLRFAPSGPPAGNDPPIDPNIFNLNYVGGLDEVVKFLRRNIVLPWLVENPRNKVANKNRGDGFGGNLIEPPKGILFYGTPGTGKTLIGKCLAGELIKLSGKNISFIMRRGTDIFDKLVGESEANLRKVFAQAEQNKPSILFFDEIDGLIPARRDGQLQHSISVVTTFLGLVDKVKRGEVFIIGATNRLDSLDAAALRPGRFDKHIRFTPPNEGGRIHILNLKMTKWEQKNRPSKREIAQIAARTSGFTGADLEQLIRNAVNFAIERDAPNLGSELHNIKNELTALRKVKVTMVDWTKAIEGMSSTNANVFESTIYCGVPLAANLMPLLGGIVQQVKAKCDGFLKLCASRNYTTGINCLLCYGATDSEIQSIDCIIIPAVIGSFDSMKIKGFIATAETGNALFGALAKAKTGALEMPSMLFIPRIDIIWTNLGPAGLQNAFLKQIEEIRNSNLLIITTARSPLAGFPTQLQDIFQGVERSIQPRKPTAAELRDFFSPVFTIDSQIHQNFIRTGKRLHLKFDKKQLNGLLTKVIRASLGEEIRSVLTFHHELIVVLSEGYNGACNASTICHNLDTTITTFIRTKFMN